MNYINFFQLQYFNYALSSNQCWFIKWARLYLSRGRIDGRTWVALLLGASNYFRITQIETKYWPPTELVFCGLEFNSIILCKQATGCFLSVGFLKVLCLFELFLSKVTLWTLPCVNIGSFAIFIQSNSIVLPELSIKYRLSQLFVSVTVFPVYRRKRSTELGNYSLYLTLKLFRLKLFY